MDPKLIKIAQELGIPIEPYGYTHFVKPEIYSKFEKWLTKYSASTAEDYAWRLHRALKGVKGFPRRMLFKYEKLVKYYKKKYAVL